MLQTMIHAIGLLPSKVQLPTWFGMGPPSLPATSKTASSAA